MRKELEPANFPDNLRTMADASICRGSMRAQPPIQILGVVLVFRFTSCLWAADKLISLLSRSPKCTPRLENRVTLDPNQRDAWGIPVLRIDCSHNEAELLLARDQTQALRELAEVAEVKLTRIDETPRPPGSAIHECGTARMGADPAELGTRPQQSVLGCARPLRDRCVVFPVARKSKSNFDDTCAYRPRLPSRTKWYELSAFRILDID